MGKKVNLFVLLFSLLILSSFVSAAKTTITNNFPTGYTIAESQQEYIQLDKNFIYHFFIYNTSNGKIPEEDVLCQFFLVDSKGNLIFNDNATRVNDGQYYFVNISKETFSKKGIYSYGLNCQNGVGGALAGEFEVTYTGNEFGLTELLVYLIVLLLLFGLLIYLIYLFPKLPKNDTNDKGMIIGVNKLSYLRPIILGVMWIIVISFTYIIANLSIAYVYADFLGNFIFGIFTIMMYSNLLILPLWIIYLINKSYKDAKIQEFIERGGMDF